MIAQGGGRLRGWNDQQKGRSKVSASAGGVCEVGVLTLFIEVETCVKVSATVARNCDELGTLAALDGRAF